MAAADQHQADPAVVAWHVDVIYEVYGSKRRGTAAGQGERSGLRKLFKPDKQLGGIRHVHAVKDVSFVAHQGESIGIIGHNGSGKSTLLRALAGLIPPTNGQIWLQGNPSLLGVNAVLLNQLSGERNIQIGGQALGLTPAQVDAAYDDIVELADIGEAIERPMSTYSSGQGARLRFAISTAVKPDVLMIDEALATGDAAFRQRSMAKITELLDGASTVFLVSHSNGTITEMCQRALWMDHGRLVMDGPADEVVKEYAKGRLPGTPDPTPKPEPKVYAVPDLGIDLRVEPVTADRTEPTDLVLWTPGSMIPESPSADLVAALGSAGVLNVSLRDDRSAPVGDLPVDEHLVAVETDGEPVISVIQRCLERFGVEPERALVLDADEDTRRALAEGDVAVRTADPAEAMEELEALVNRHGGTAEAPLDAARALVARQRDRATTGSSESEHLGRHPIHVALLDGLAALHLAPRIEQLAQRSSRHNWTETRFGIGESTLLLTDVGRNEAKVVVAWDDFGFHGVVGFVSLDRPGGALRHFVFDDATASLSIAEAVAAHLAKSPEHAAAQFPVHGARPWIQFEDASSAAVREVLGEHGLAAPARPDLRVMGGNETGRLAFALAGRSFHVADPSGKESLKVASQTSFRPGAGLVALWAGREYDDRVWGAGAHGLDAYRRSARALVEKSPGLPIVVLLPTEDFTEVEARPFTQRARFAECNQVWRELAAEHPRIDLVEAGPILEGKTVANPMDVTAAMLGAWAERIEQHLDGDQRPTPAPVANDPQHLVPVAHYSHVGELAGVPLQLPHVWEGTRSSTWEIEIRSSQEGFAERGALLLLEVDDPEAVRTVPGGLSVFGKPSADYFHYLWTRSEHDVTRCTIQGTRPFSLTSASLQLWGKEPLPVRVEDVRIWVHRPLAPAPTEDPSDPDQGEDPHA